MKMGEAEEKKKKRGGEMGDVKNASHATKEKKKGASTGWERKLTLFSTGWSIINV